MHKSKKCTKIEKKTKKTADFAFRYVLGFELRNYDSITSLIIDKVLGSSDIVKFLLDMPAEHHKDPFF